MVRILLASAGDSGSIPGLGRSPGESNGNPLQYSCLENPMDREKSVEHNLATKTVKKKKKEKESFVKWPCTVLWFKESECICRFLFVFLRSLLCIVRNWWGEEIIQRGDCFDSRSMLSHLCVISFGTTVKLRQAFQAVLAEFWVLFMRAAYIRLQLDSKVQWVALCCGLHWWPGSLLIYAGWHSGARLPGFKSQLFHWLAV